VGRSVLFDPKNPQGTRSLPRGPRLQDGTWEAFQTLHAKVGDAAITAAQALGLGQILDDPDELLAALEDAWSAADRQRLAFPASAEDAVSFFAMLCDAIRRIRARSEEDAATFVERLGDSGVPIFPVQFGARGVALVRAERRNPGRRVERAQRVVFWIPPDTTTHGGLPKTPPEVPVFVLAAGAVEAGLTELAHHGRQWGTAELRTRRDLLLRVADELATEPMERVVAALPWLSRRLREVRDSSIAPSETGAWRGWNELERLDPRREERHTAARDRYA